MQQRYESAVVTPPVALDDAELGRDVVDIAEELECLIDQVRADVEEEAGAGSATVAAPVTRCERPSPFEG